MFFSSNVQPEFLGFVFAICHLSSYSTLTARACVHLLVDLLIGPGCLLLGALETILQAEQTQLPLLLQSSVPKAQSPLSDTSLNSF